MSARLPKHYTWTLYELLHLFGADGAPNNALCMAVHAWCRFLHSAVFAAAIGCVDAILSLSSVRNSFHSWCILKLSFAAISYAAFHFGGCTAITFIPGADAAFFPVLRVPLNVCSVSCAVQSRKFKCSLSKVQGCHVKSCMSTDIVRIC